MSLEQSEQPWYRVLDTLPPFKLRKRISSNATDAPDFRTLACFPWDKHSLSTLWNGTQNTVHHAEAWDRMVSKYWDAVAVGAERQVFIFFTHTKREPVCINLPKEPEEKLIAADKISVAWAIAHYTLAQPLLIFSRGSLLYIYNLESAGMSSYLRGHGGAITSIAVHPLIPDLFCTTSRDHSTRIYNLTFPPVVEPNNTHWPPAPKGVQSRAGPAHGLHMNQPEGSGLGRCIVVLMGGRSGGHNAAVLGAAFHPHLPLIATCGMDRDVKIWAVKTDSIGAQIVREDKPLFSSRRLHKARVLSIAWLQHDVLISHSAAAIVREDPNDPDNKLTKLEPAQLVVWRWLAMDRFYPPNTEHLRQVPLRGCAADYQESSSFKIVAVYDYDPVSTQYIVPQVTLFQSPTHDPLIISTFPDESYFLVTNVASLEPRKMPSFEEVFPDIGETEPSDLAAETERLDLTDEPDEADESSTTGYNPEFLSLPKFIPAQLSRASWAFHLRPDEQSRLQCTAMACHGRLVVGVGSKGTLLVWEVQSL